MNGKKILVIDDDVNLCQIVKFAFGRHGADVVVARDGREGLQKLYQHRPDLVILYIRMPDMDGWETCRQIRLVSSVPIIMLTNVNRDEEVVRALDHGADDFVTKPFSQEVLIARARAVLRRGDLAEEEQSPLQFQDDHLLIDLDKRQIYVEGEPVRLTATEYRLLSYLLRNANQVLTYDAILKNVWGAEYKDSVEYVHVYLSHLRRKIEKEPRNPQYLLTEHSVGYRFQWI